MRKIFPLSALAFAAAISCANMAAAFEQAPARIAQVSDAAAKKQLDAIAAQYYESVAKFDPVGASENGDNRFDDQLGMTISPKLRARQFALYRGYAKRLHAVQRWKLDRRDQVNYDVLDYELKSNLSMEKFPEHLLPMDQMDSMPVTLANYAGGQAAQSLTSAKGYRDYLSRLRQLPAWIDQATANMREGIKTGVTLPRAAMVSALPQIQKLAASDVYLAPLKAFPKALSEKEKASFTAQYQAAFNKLQPKLKAFASFLEKEYLPATRTSTGWSALPNGAEWYLASVAASTTTTMQPEEIHAVGQKEVARIQAEFAVLGPKMGYTGPAAGLPQWVSQQDKYRPFTTEQEVLDVYRKLDTVLRTKLPALFTLMPKAPLDIRLEPELTRATASDHYTSPAADGSRPGVFWTVVNDPKQYGSTGVVTLFLHEGQPGHHFHIALLQELNLPNFRKFGGNNAFTEGWALYAETLGKEMGLFDKPEDYFGHLNDELLRAARLVVDTGMHAKGWTREQGIQYFRDTLGYSEGEARAQIERYMVWPGQALGYKVGSLKIAGLRAKAAAALGDKFSLQKFHEIVLKDGTVPLSLLESKVNAWIEEGK